MINHLRTLLLNLPASPDAEREEFVEASFTTRSLNSNQSALAAAVFPGPFNRTYRNFIATALTRLVAASPFATDIWDLDPRVLLSDPVMSARGFNPSVSIVRIENANAVIVGGKLIPDVNSGVFTKKWQIRESGMFAVEILDFQTGAYSTQVVTFDEGSSLRIPLDHSVYITLSEVSEVPAGLAAIVTANAPLSYSITDLESRLLSSNVRQLMALPGRRELSIKCLEQFDSSHRPDLTIAAALTAYAYSFEV